MSRSSDENSGPPSSSHTDNLAYSFELDGDLVDYLQFDGDKVCGVIHFHFHC